MSATSSAVPRIQLLTPLSVLGPPGFGEARAGTAADVDRPEEPVGVETGRRDDDVDVDLGAVAAAQAVGGDLGDALGDEVDVIAAQGSVPAGVQQHPLDEGRVVRQRLGDEIGVALEFGLDVAGEHAPVPVVGRVDPAFRVLPLRVDLQRRVDPVVEVPGERARYQTR